MTSAVRWGSPPPNLKAADVDWHATLAPFAGRRGHWGQVPGTYPPSVVTKLTKGLTSRPRGRWKFTSRTVPESNPRRVFLWACYLGPEAASGPAPCLGSDPSGTNPLAPATVGDHSPSTPVPLGPETSR